ncbi:MAG: VCBS repeat-containing protein [Gemmatimonadetes bacterium]|nr:VCBS repeat-containing protein [Gemmatimonadota bacterium]
MRAACELRKSLGLLLIGAAACVPDIELKAEATAAGSGSGGSAGGPIVCVDAGFEEWSFDTGLSEELGTTIVDLDSDGLGDVASSFQLSAAAMVQWGKPGPGAGETTKKNVQRPSGWIRHGDFDGDGRGDLVLTSTFYSTQSVLLQKQSRTFTLVAIEQLTDGKVLVVDVEGDGAQDLLFRTADEYVVRPGDGKGNFGPAKTYVGIPRSDELDSGDFDGDGKFELLRMRKDAPLVILSVGPGGALAEMPIDGSALETLEGPTFVADVDGDGKSEAVIATGSRELGFIELRTHNHDATPRFDRCVRVPFPPSLVNDPQIANHPKGSVNFSAVGDVNGDGKADFFFNNACPACPYRHSLMVQVP